ncbi:hypothetical protein, partial [Phascolarctobacterium faecium]|uniref:hypothetical protein n=1 Tax=Phascolarctobacterium faecium TaxID=33025 RepID=UPI00210AD070
AKFYGIRRNHCHRLYKGQISQPYVGIFTTGSDTAAYRSYVLGINRFGASAPGDVMMEKYGFTVENLVAKVKSVL